MKVLTVFAHNDRRSFCGGVLDRFSVSREARTALATTPPAS